MLRLHRWMDILLILLLHFLLLFLQAFSSDSRVMADYNEVRGLIFLET